MIEEEIAALEARIQQCYIVCAQATEQVEACVTRAEQAAMRAELATSQSQLAAVASEAASIVSVAATEQALEVVAEQEEEEEEPMPEKEEEEHAKEENAEIPLRPDDEAENRTEPGIQPEPIVIRVEPEREPDKPASHQHKRARGFKRGRS